MQTYGFETVQRGTAMHMLIDGNWTGASDGAVDAVLNPATGEEIATVPRASAADIARAVAAAQDGAGARQ